MSSIPLLHEKTRDISPLVSPFRTFAYACFLRFFPTILHRARTKSLALVLALISLTANAQLPPVSHPDDIPWITVSPGVQLKELTGLSAAKGARTKLGSVALFRLAPGKASAWSHNKIGEESFFILKGHGEVWTGSRSQPVQPGSYILIPPKVVRSIRASKGETLEYYALTTPSWSKEDDVHVLAPKNSPK